MHFAAMAMMPLAPLVAGSLLDRLGGVQTLLLLGIATAAVALIPTMSRRVRSVPRPADWQAQAEAGPELVASAA
jgi:hypothetical protein